MRRQELQALGKRIGKHINRHYPFPHPKKAACVFLNFNPRSSYRSYEDHLPDFIETFLQAHIYSRLERDTRVEMRAMMASIKTHSIAGVKAALENNEFPLHFNHRDELLDLIDDASAEFLESLESTAALREDAKISYITIISLRENVRNWYAP